VALRTNKMSSKVNMNDVQQRLDENITIYFSKLQKPMPGSRIPQRPYCQGTAIPGGVGGQSIMFTTTDGGGFPAGFALLGQCNNLVDGNGVVFIEPNHTINLRIEWPGYDGWGGQIRIVNYQEEPKGISRAKLVREIAKQLEKFIERMASVTIDPDYVQYRVGPGGIEPRHIQIASLEQVSRGSWQPLFVYSG